MTRTVIGLFDTTDAAFAAERALGELGIGKSAISLTAGLTPDEAAGPDALRLAALRDFLVGLFGADNAAQAEAYAEEVARGRALLSVAVSDARMVLPVCEAMQDAEVLDLGGAPRGGIGDSPA